MTKNQIIGLKIDSVTLSGYGVARFDGMAVFVLNTCPGEEIEAKVLSVKKNYAYAKVMRYLTSSPFRALPTCPVFTKCGGCVFQHMDYKAECALKDENIKQTIRRIGGVEPIFEPFTGSDCDLRYRNKAQYPVREEDGEIVTGFYAFHSHRVVKCTDCVLQPSEFREITDCVVDFCEKTGITAYNETTFSGTLRHIYLRKGVNTGEIMVCLVINSDNIKNSGELTERLLKINKNIASIVLNINKDKTNVILGKRCKTIFGKGYIEDTLCGKRFRISPLSFYQVNNPQAQRLYEKAAEYAALTKDKTLLDLYCGVGTIGLTMADRAKLLYGVEVVPEAVENAITNAKINNIENAEFICADAAKAAAQLKKKGVKPDVIIIDPPRKGCDEALIKTISELSPERVVYVSCEVATLARDLKRFSALSYECERCQGFDLFPKTGNTECVALIKKRA